MLSAPCRRHYRSKQVEANARLIDAAPDLLAALKALADEAEKIVIAVDETGKKWAVLDGYIDVVALDNAQALVKKLEKDK